MLDGVAQWASVQLPNRFCRSKSVTVCVVCNAKLECGRGNFVFLFLFVFFPTHFIKLNSDGVCAVCVSHDVWASDTDSIVLWNRQTEDCGVKWSRFIDIQDLILLFWYWIEGEKKIRRLFGALFMWYSTQSRANSIEWNMFLSSRYTRVGTPDK